MKVLIYKSEPLASTETFIRASIENSPFQTVFVAGKYIFKIENQPELFRKKLIQMAYSICTRLGSKWVEKLKNYLFKQIIKQLKPDLVLAQFGPSGSNVYRACQETQIPFVVYFRGYDASVNDVIESYREDYRKMFGVCTATICVSKSIRDRIIALGANPETAFVNPSGADLRFLAQGISRFKEKKIVSVGRFVEKKAPHLLLLSFVHVLEVHPDATLLMIGEGPLLSACKDLAEALGISKSVIFSGAQPHCFVLEAMSLASLFVQHSIAAQNGDSEGTPVAVMEASAAGLPVIATKHAGIVDVIISGITGYLVEEKDIIGMAAHMKELLSNPELMQQMGAAGKERIRNHFSHDVCLSRLDAILNWTIYKHRGKGSDLKPPLLPDWSIC